MKIPNWMYERQTIVAHPESTINGVAKMLRIEAQLYRVAGRENAAQAIRQVAARLTEISANGWSPAVAFDWPKRETEPQNGSNKDG